MLDNFECQFGGDKEVEFWIDLWVDHHMVSPRDIPYSLHDNIDAKVSDFIKYDK